MLTRHYRDCHFGVDVYFSVLYLVKLQFSFVSYFSHCERNFAGVRNVEELRPAISADPNPNDPSSRDGLKLLL